MRTIQEVAKKYDCLVIEDASQAQGAKCYQQHVGKFSDLTALSLYPGKGLGAAGDAGLILTDNEEYYLKILALRNLGSIEKYYHEVIGWNNRLDPIQAIILNNKLPYLDEWNNKRNFVAQKYTLAFENNKNIVTPKTANYVDQHAWHIYTILVNNRADLQKYLNKKGVSTIIHYPIPIQKSIPYFYLDKTSNSPKTIKNCKKLLSLPIHPFLSEEEINKVIGLVEEFVHD